MRRTILSFTALAAMVLAVPVAAQEERDAAERLHELFEQAWAWELAENPLLATEVGVRGYDDRLPSVSVEDEARQVRVRREFLERLRAIDRAALGPQDRVSYDMFERELTGSIAAFEHRAYLLPITAEWGFHLAFAQLPGRVPLRTAEDYENYIARLRAFRHYADQHVALLREGLRTGMTLPRIVLEGYDQGIAAHVVEDVEQSVFHSPFTAFPDAIPPVVQVRLREAGEAAIREAVVPGYRAFLEFMRDEYIPGARETIGASEMPGGREYYAHLVRSFTTLDVSPEEVHRLGLQEVERIRGEMLDVIRSTGFEGGFDAFLEFLRTDPRFYVDSPEALLKEASFIAKKMDGQLPKLFRTLPRQPYGVEPVPADLAPKFTTGRYVSAPPGGTRAGTYWVNTYALDSRPLYALEALTLHEAVPGHHLQIALAREMEGLPDFRRFAGVSAYTEGWALYSERLGKEVGFYTDPYSEFGRLSYEMWRACRLVVDTGMHAFGWSRDRALDFLAENTALPLHEVRTEIDRYISWPGQALAYKMGELKIRELRADAEQALGAAFDIREFHDVVLGSGVLPLPVLETQVEEWIAAKR